MGKKMVNRVILLFHRIDFAQGSTNEIQRRGCTVNYVQHTLYTLNFAFQIGSILPTNTGL